jgi:hypothetical protein
VQTMVSMLATKMGHDSVDWPTVPLWLCLLEAVSEATMDPASENEMEWDLVPE